MFEKLKEKFFKKDSHELISSFNPISFPLDTSFSKKKYFTLNQIKDEFLDPKDSKEVIFTIYENFCKSHDSLIFETSSLKSDLYVIYSKFIGREFAKTSLFSIQESMILFEVLHGSGYVIMQNIEDEKDIKLIKISKSSQIIISNKYSFAFINSDEKENLCIISLQSSKINLIKDILKNKNGAALFLTKSGFLKNYNYSALYNLEEIESDYLEDFSFDKEKGIYKEFISLPEKFKFLNP